MEAKGDAATNDSPGGGPPTGPAGTDAMVNELGELLAQLEDQPENIPLLRHQIRLMKQLDMIAQVLDCVIRLSSLVMLSEDLWIEYLELLIQSSIRPLSLDTFVEVLERFEQAERDYLSAAILLKHIEFVLLCSRSTASALASVSEPSTTIGIDADLTDFLTEDATRGMLGVVVQRGQGLLSESHLLWQLWLDWEIGLLRSREGEARKEQIDHIHNMFSERMSIPHSTLSSTSSMYSTFCSEHSPEHYEARLVQATEVAQAAKTKWSAERRYGKTREDYEQQLAYSLDPSIQGQVYLSYIGWETDQRAKKSTQIGKAGPSSDLLLIVAVFERSIALYSKAASATESAIGVAELADKAAQRKERKAGKKGKDKVKAKDGAANVADAATRQNERRLLEETARAYKEGESDIWERYCSWADEAGGHYDAETLRSRAARACPQIAASWCRLMHGMELAERPIVDLTATFDMALALGLLTVPDGPVNGVVDLFICRAAFESRTEPTEKILGEYHPVMMTLLRGLQLVAKVNKAGDASLRLEKFLLDWAETRARHLLGQALLLVDTPSKARAASYQMVLLRTGIETRRGGITEARQAFITAIQRSDLDWPEAVYDAFVQFENVHGDLTTLLRATKAIGREKEKLVRRREKAAAEQIEQYHLQVAASTVQEDTTTVMDIGMAVEAAPILLPHASAIVDDTVIRRDREHTTVLLNGLAKGIDAARVEAFFDECGPIRETTVLSSDDQTSDAALVEFKQVEAVPPALDRNRKKLDGREVSVSMLWRSTLFVTNFSRDTDDAALRLLFAQYGNILQTRWPSRKYAADRRFCYITMDSPASAQHALILHGLKLDGGFGLTVYISDPAAKTKRTDDTNSTLFIGGLTKGTKQQDVEDMLRPLGMVRSVKLGWDTIKRICKGFAFVEMVSEADAKSCLTLHGKQLNGKFLKVEISDPNYANKKPSDSISTTAARQAAEKRSRTVRLHYLPEGTQEGLLQQALEKIVPVKRLEMFTNVREAIAELESQSDAGLLLLRPEPFVFEGVTILITEKDGRPSRGVARMLGNGAPPSSALSFAPRIARKTGIGKGRQAPAADKSLPPAMATSSGTNGTRDQNDFRALVEMKNKKREAKLAEAINPGQAEKNGEKRPAEDAEDGEGHEAKRSRLDA